MTSSWMQVQHLAAWKILKEMAFLHVHQS